MNDGDAPPKNRLVFDVDELHEPAFSVTLSRRIVTWNAAAERYFSVRTADVIGHYCFEIVVQQPGMRGTPCAFCSIAKTARTRDSTLSNGSTGNASHMDAVSTTCFRTFTARSTTGEVQLVHMLNTVQPPSIARNEPSPYRGDHTPLELLPPLLTPREREVLRLLADGLSTIEIAARLSISRITARNHVTHVMDKLEVKSRLRAVIVATQKGLL
ncbi:MAG TPA: LuxR C-terminal-related transcriptional regulator [Ktedonobacterales bacterium]|nr:LuxR C-terminal-related transcriptional regulator [Ktedonobacterales bacterium]